MRADQLQLPASLVLISEWHLIMLPMPEESMMGTRERSTMMSRAPSPIASFHLSRNSSTAMPIESFPSTHKNRGLTGFSNLSGHRTVNHTPRSAYPRGASKI